MGFGRVEWAEHKKKLGVGLAVGASLHSRDYEISYCFDLTPAYSTPRSFLASVRQHHQATPGSVLRSTLDLLDIHDGVNARQRHEQRSKTKLMSKGEDECMR